MYKKSIVFIGLLLLSLFAAGCNAVQRGTQPPESFKLGEDIFIEGMDVSREQIASAREIVQSRIDSMIQSMHFDVVLQEPGQSRTAKVEGTDLPIRTNLEDMLREAAYLPQHNGLRQQRRELSIKMWLDTEAAQKQIETLGNSFYINPVNATVELDRSQDGMFVYTMDRTGIEAKSEELLQLLANAVGHKTSERISLPYTVLYPDYTEEQARSEHQLVATFSTSFAKSPYNGSGRVFNIKKAVDLIDGTKLSPGQEFDINSILGPRNAKNGWRMATGIREGRYQQEYGGGVCQVSTTLFNAVMMADLTILERRPHSWPLGYIDIGRDATISTGGPNFRFVNSSACDLYVLAKTNAQKQITISLYGNPLPDGMSIKISSKRTASLSAPGQDVLLDETLPSNTRVVFREAHRGKKSQTYKEYYDAEGNLIRQQLAYEDTYRSIRGTVYISSDLYYGTSENEEEEGQLSVKQ